MAKPKFNIGDLVFLVGETDSTKHNGLFFVDSMKKKVGNFAKIVSFHNKSPIEVLYELDTDEWYLWAEDWLEPAILKKELIGDFILGGDENAV